MRPSPFVLTKKWHDICAFLSRGRIPQGKCSSFPTKTNQASGRRANDNWCGRFLDRLGQIRRRLVEFIVRWEYGVNYRRLNVHFSWSLLKIVETSRKPQFPRAAPVPSGGMVTILFALVSLFAFRFRSRASLELELIALRHQVIVLRRQRPHRLRLLSADRLRLRSPCQVSACWERRGANMPAKPGKPPKTSTPCRFGKLEVLHIECEKCSRPGRYGSTG
jgi:hypothetical protein